MDPEYRERIVRLETISINQQKILEEIRFDVKLIRKDSTKFKGFIGGMTLTFTGLVSVFLFGWEYLKTKVGV